MYLSTSLQLLGQNKNVLLALFEVRLAPRDDVTRALRAVRGARRREEEGEEGSLDICKATEPKRP